jgi:SAM-dependent methyltransferase
MDWDRQYREGDVFWDKGAPAPALRQYLEQHPVRGRTLVPGCGRGHDLAMAVAQGLDAVGLDLAPTAIAQARALYPSLAERFLVGDLFDPPAEFRGAFDVVLEHTCLAGLEPALRSNYRGGIDLILRPGGMLIGVWFINPALEPGEVGPPFGISLNELNALFGKEYEVVDDYVPDVAFPARVGRERLRVLRRRPASDKSDSRVL